MFPTALQESQVKSDKDTRWCECPCRSAARWVLRAIEMKEMRREEMGNEFDNEFDKVTYAAVEELFSDGRKPGCFATFLLTHLKSEEFGRILERHRSCTCCERHRNLHPWMK
jgi:hypothetical protein